MPEDFKAGLAAAEAAKQQETEKARGEAFHEDELRTKADNLQAKSEQLNQEAVWTEHAIRAVEETFANSDISATERKRLEQVRAEAQGKLAELGKVKGDLAAVQREIKELNEPAEKDVNIDGKFLGREVKQFELSSFAGGGQMGGDVFSEAYLETGSGNIYKIYSDDGGATFIIVDARSNKGAGLNVKGAVLSAEDLAATVKVGEQFKYRKDKNLNTSPITKITVVNKRRQYAEGALPTNNSDVGGRFKEVLRPEKRPTTPVDTAAIKQTMRDQQPARGTPQAERASLDRAVQYPMGQSVEQTPDRKVTLKKRSIDGGNIKFKNGVLEIPVDGTEKIGIVCDGEATNGAPTPDSYMPMTNIIALSKTTMENFRKRDRLPEARGHVEQMVRHELNHYLFEKTPKASREKIMSIFLKYARKQGSGINKFFGVLYEHPESAQSKHYVQVAEQTLKTLKSRGESPQAASFVDKQGVKHTVALDSVIDEMMAFASWKDVNYNPDQIKTGANEEMLQFQQILKSAADAMSELTQEERGFIQKELFQNISGPPEQASKKYMNALMRAVETMDQENS